MRMPQILLVVLLAGAVGCGGGGGNTGHPGDSGQGSTHFDVGHPLDAGVAGVDVGGAADAGTDAAEPLSSLDDFRENSISGVQTMDIAQYRLAITGLVGHPASYTYDDVMNTFDYYERPAWLHCVEGWSVNIMWGGVLLKDIFAAAAPRPEAKVVILRAYDGYSTSVPIGFISDRNIILAYRMNGQTVPPERGFPFVLAADGKWGYKWIKWITEIELSDDVSYRGYWESFGYSVDGSYDKPSFE